MYTIRIKLMTGWITFKENVLTKEQVITYIKTFKEFYPEREIKVYKEIPIKYLKK